MPRPRKDATSPQLTAGQSVYVLNRLLADRRVSQSEVNRYVADMSREIGDLERRLAELRAAHSGGGAVSSGSAAAAPARRRGRAAAAVAVAGGARRRRRPKMTAAHLASQRLQGRYLGLVRQFPASRRPHFAKIAKEKGREAAIKEMLEQRKK